MYAFQASIAAPAGMLSAPAFRARERIFRQFSRRGPLLGEAAKAGISVAVSSAIILAVMFVLLHTMPVGIG
jgi:hypothetical protein